MVLYLSCVRFCPAGKNGAQGSKKPAQRKPQANTDTLKALISAIAWQPLLDTPANYHSHANRQWQRR
jgi:hypothetical protein